MLHADAALRMAGFTKEANEQRLQHLTAARRMLHASGPPDDPFISRWYLAVSRAFRERQWFRVAEDLLERGRADAPGNPIVLYESATVAETLARGYLMTAPAARAVIHSIESDTARSVLQRAGMLNDAAEWLREALERDGTMLMARLHLGRVETLRGNEQDGLVHLERVVSATTDPATAYLAALFSGAAHERLRRPDAAEASYRQAIARFPVGTGGVRRAQRGAPAFRKDRRIADGTAKPAGREGRLRPRAVVVVPGRAAGRGRRAARRAASRGAPVKPIVAAAALAIVRLPHRPWHPNRPFASAWTRSAWTCSSPTATARSGA